MNNLEESIKRNFSEVLTEFCSTECELNEDGFGDHMNKLGQKLNAINPDRDKYMQQTADPDQGNLGNKRGISKGKKLGTSFLNLVNKGLAMATGQQYDLKAKEKEHGGYFADDYFDYENDKYRLENQMTTCINSMVSYCALAEIISNDLTPTKLRLVPVDPDGYYYTKSNRGAQNYVQLVNPNTGTYNMNMTDIATDSNTTTDVWGPSSFQAQKIISSCFRVNPKMIKKISQENYGWLEQAFRDKLYHAQINRTGIDRQLTSFFRELDNVDHYINRSFVEAQCTDINDAQSIPEVMRLAQRKMWVWNSKLDSIAHLAKNNYWKVVTENGDDILLWYFDMNELYNMLMNLPRVTDPSVFIQP